MRGEFVYVAGTGIYYYAAGTRGAGDPVVFLHGFAASGHVWHRLAPLVPAGHRVVVLDLPGHGRSEWPVNTRSVPFGAAEHARYVRVVLNELRISRAALVGHGLGAEVARELCARAPQKISGLLLISPGDGTAIPLVPRRTSVLGVVSRFPSGPLARTILRRSIVDGYVDRAAGRRSAERFTRSLTSSAVRSLVRAHSTAALEGGHAPAHTRVVIGTDDPYIDREAVVRRFADAEHVKTLPGLRHFLPEESADDLAGELTRLLSA